MLSQNFYGKRGAKSVKKRKIPLKNWEKYGKIKGRIQKSRHLDAGYP
jgi:hypothetical protein